MKTDIKRVISVLINMSQAGILEQTLDLDSISDVTTLADFADVLEEEWVRECEDSEDEY